MGLLSELPIELLTIIGGLLHRKDLKALRETCRRLGEVFLPCVWTGISIDLHGDEQSSRHQIARLEFLASLGRRWRGFQYIRSLKLDRLSPGAIVGDKQRTGFENTLSALLPLCKYVTRVSWSMTHWSTYNPVALSVYPLFARSMLSFIYLEELTVEMGSIGLAFPFDKLPPLRSLSVSDWPIVFETSQMLSRLAHLVSRSRRLINLKLDGPTSVGDELGRQQSFHYMTRLCPRPLRLQKLHLRNVDIRLDQLTTPHLRNLTSITFALAAEDYHPTISAPRSTTSGGDPTTAVPSCSPQAQFWDTMRREQIFLEEITVHQISTSLLAYLESYSDTLRILDIRSAVEMPAPQQAVLTTRFSDTTLPRHQNSLEGLSLMAPFPSRWTLDDALLPVLTSNEADECTARLWRLIKLSVAHPGLEKIYIGPCSGADYNEVPPLDTRPLCDCLEPGDILETISDLREFARDKQEVFQPIPHSVEGVPEDDWLRRFKFRYRVRAES